MDIQIHSLDNFYDAHHPTVSKLIKMAIENIYNAGIWVGIWGFVCSFAYN
ncbi:hypothetical protein [[Clostridium] fimetarium]